MTEKELSFYHNGQPGAAAIVRHAFRNLTKLARIVYAKLLDYKSMHPVHTVSFACSCLT
jgi:acid stress-induced BolA-like protein IbaG/YrbA